MNEQIVEKYFEAIVHELKNLEEHFTGNIEFKLNYKDGGIANMNVILGKSVRLFSPEK